MDIIVSKTVCFTGHRPEKLPAGGSEYSKEVKILKSMLYRQILNAVNEGFDTFITGMQRGIDLWAGEIVLSLTAQRSLKLVAVLPYRDFGKKFKGSDKWNFNRIKSSADMIVIISDEYTPDCLSRRNRFMVDNSSRLIAVLGEEKSGTGQTVRYARKKGLDINCIDISALYAADSGQLSF